VTHSIGVFGAMTRSCTSNKLWKPIVEQELLESE